ncbi:ABC transporter permease subunit [Candidatus Bathyarchaeota archaeon]|nr:ABC transporter permease subunit [Candidatus Bathyarchaeota archaeon]
MWIRIRLKRFRKDIQPNLRELKFSINKMKKSPLSIVGIGIILFFFAIAILAPVLAPTPEGWRDPYMIPREGYSSIPTPPSEKHPFGTVGTGGQYDIYYGCIWGTRTAIYVGIVVVGSNVLVALLIGSISGYYGGKIDEVLMRITDVMFAFPALILAMALVTAFGPSLDSVVKALIIVGWPSYARVIRGEVISVKENDYIEAAKAVGCSDLRVIIRHILPNSIYPLVIMASLDLGAIVLTVAALSFLGLGPQPGFADWGQMISFSRNWIVEGLKYWYTWTIPGLFIFIFVLGWNLLGDAFRDVLDPTLRRR